MAYEITYFYHPRKASGGYDTNQKQEKLEKVGKAFEETPLSKAAAAIMGQLARRDIWVVDVKVVELVRKEVNFKESKDGKGIVLKNKKFSLNGAVETIFEENVEEAPKTILSIPLPPAQPIQPNQDLHELYSNPNKSLAPKVQTPAVNPNKKPLYYVYFDPEIHYIGRAKQMGLKFQKDKKYPVLGVSGSIGQQKLSLIDDTGRLVSVDDIFFQTVGAGLFGDAQLGFSKPAGKEPKLTYENELVLEMPQQNKMAATSMYKVDDGTIPADLMGVPDIRAKK